MNTIQDAKIKDKKVLLKVDFNVPIKDGKIEGDKRIRESLPTIQYLLDKGVTQIIIITHLGKPQGKKDDKYSLYPVANKLAELLSIDVNFSIPQDEYRLSDKIVMLENLRFNPGEEENSLEFAKELASQADIFVNDAFGTMHRAHASTSGVAVVLPSYAGLLVQKEIEYLEKLLNSKEKPFTVILGGAKITDKLPVIKNLMSKADNFLIGGAIANTFLAARRHHMGKSKVEPDSFREANIIWQNIMDEPDKNIFLPTDIVVSKAIEKPIDLKNIKVKELLNMDGIEEEMVVDIGPNTIQTFSTQILQSKRIFWNGNMGVSEVSEFSEGDKMIAETITKSSAQVVIGGGDTVSAVEKILITNNLITNNIYLSTGGGATLEFLAGKELPGLKVLGYKCIGYML